MPVELENRLGLQVAAPEPLQPLAGPPQVAEGPRSPDVSLDGVEFEPYRPDQFLQVTADGKAEIRLYCPPGFRRREVLKVGQSDACCTPVCRLAGELEPERHRFVHHERNPATVCSVTSTGVSN